MKALPSVLITGASTGIGAVYAERFAQRGHNLVLVARDKARLDARAHHLHQQYGVDVDVLPADLLRAADLDAVAKRVAQDQHIEILVNNAGMHVHGDFVDQTPQDVARIMALNTTAVVTLTHAIAPRLAAAETGAIINIASVVGLAPEFNMTVYGATKAFVLFFSQGLSQELAAKGVYVQAVLPAATRTEIWERSGADITTMTGVMDVEELVDAALVGFDRRETITIPPLHKPELWAAFQQARQAMLPEFSQEHAAGHYRTYA